MRNLFKMVMMLVVLISFMALPQIGLAEEYTSGEEVKKEEAKKEETAKEEKKAVELEDIVVTATRTEKGLEDVPGSVSVVTKKDMEKRSIKSVDEALNTTTGIYHSNMGGGMVGHPPSISIRGISGGARTLVMLDGLPVNNPCWGGARFYLMSAGDVERIEVVKGPFSSLYGGNAMAGVVNVITKMPEKREFTLKSGYGSSWDRGESMDDLKKIYFSFGDKYKDKISLFASYGRKDTNGYPASLNVQSKMPTAGITGWTETTDVYGATRYLIGDAGDRNYWDDQITLKTRLDFTKDSKLNLSFMRARNGKDCPEPHTYLKDAAGNDVWTYGTVKESSFLTGSGGNEQNIYGIGFETKFSSVKTKIALGYLDVGTSWWAWGGTTATSAEGPGYVTDTPGESYNADIQFTAPLFDRHILTFGSSFRSGWADSKKYNLTNWKDEKSKSDLTYQMKGKDRTYALFVQDEVMILNNLTAYLGFRQDWWETYDGLANDVGKAGYPVNYDKRDDSSFSPKAALVYKPFDATSLRTSVGKAFRPPTVSDLYQRTTYASGITSAGNPDLEPETTTSWDAGIEQGMWKGMKVKATYFENYMEDLIYTTMTTATLREKVNAGKAESKGVELEAEQSFDMGLRLFANFTYTDAKMKKNEAKPDTEGKKLTGIPERMFNAGAVFDRGPFSASLTGRYTSKRYRDDMNLDVKNNVWGSYDPYFTADAKVSYKLTRFASVSLSVDNILDEDYFGYYKGAGRSWFSELTMKF